MDPIQKNIPIFGQERYSFLEVIKQYSDAKTAYDGAIATYGRISYGTRLLEGLGGNVPVRHQFSLDEMSRSFSVLPGIPEAMGFEFEVPLRKGFKANLLAELWPWDYSERLASVALDKVFYNSPTDRSGHDLFYNEGEDEYVFLSMVLNREKETDFDQPETFLQSKISSYLERGNPVTNRLFLLRIKQIVWSSESELEDILKNFECRDDSVILEILD